MQCQERAKMMLPSRNIEFDILRTSSPPKIPLQVRRSTKVSFSHHAQNRHFNHEHGNLSGPYRRQKYLSSSSFLPRPGLLTTVTASATPHRSPRSLSSAWVYTAWKKWVCRRGEASGGPGSRILLRHDNAGESRRKECLKTHCLFDDCYKYGRGSWRRGAILGTSGYQISRTLALRLEQAERFGRLISTSLSDCSYASDWDGASIRFERLISVFAVQISRLVVR